MAKTLKDYINLNAKDEFGMFVRTHGTLTGEKMVEKICHAVHDKVKNSFDGYFKEVIDTTQKVETIKGFEGIVFPALPLTVRGTMVDLVEEFARKYRLNMIEQGYILREVYQAIQNAIDPTIQQIVNLRAAQINSKATILQKASGLVDTNGQPLR